MTELRVPCISVNKENLQKWWPHIIKTLSESDFVAIDLELSGLGAKDLFASQIDERYVALKEVASTRAVLSMGLACFKINPQKGYFKRKPYKNHFEQASYDQIHDCLDKSLEESDEDSDEKQDILKNTEFELDEEDEEVVEDIVEDIEDEDFHVEVHVYDFICLCNEYILESKSMKFLVQQGFDFNELARNGIFFSRGNDMKFEDSSYSIRSLLVQIISIQPTVIFHNGLLDLAFLYQNFYCEMPTKLDSFVADLFEMFPKGIFDTKYIAQSYLANSYLEYLFNHSQRNNYFRKIKKQSSINLTFEVFDEPWVQDIKISDLSAKIFEVKFGSFKTCDNYAKYGWCDKLDMCQYSHNIDLILDAELKSKKGRSNKELIKHLKALSTEPCSKKQDSVPMRKCGSHHSGNDAFMTGYYFLYYLILNNNKTTFTEFKKYYENLTKFKNKIFLSGKTHPLNIMKSSFSKCSCNHTKKFKKIRENKEKKKNEEKEKNKVQ